MVQSMTGYGKASGEFNGKKIIVEIKSLNSKQMDISARLTNPYREKEIEIRNEVAQALVRGKIDIAIYVENAIKDNLTQINTTVFEAYHQQISDLADKLTIGLPSNWFEVILRMPDVMKVETTELTDDEWKVLREIISEALRQIQGYRIQEGKSLTQVFIDRINDIRTLLISTESYEPERIARIKSRLEDNLQNISEKFDYDQNRLEQELIFYIEKLDINEEKVRLRTHLDYFLEMMENEDSPGKKLGFIAQEIGREINTLGSKSNHGEMQKLVVLMKDNLEQIKEQILNVL